MNSKAITKGLRGREEFMTMRWPGEFLLSTALTDNADLYIGDRFRVDASDKVITLTKVTTEEALRLGRDAIVMLRSHSSRLTPGGRRRVFFRSQGLFKMLDIDPHTHRGAARYFTETTTGALVVEFAYYKKGELQWTAKPKRRSSNSTKG